MPAPEDIPTPEERERRRPPIGDQVPEQARNNRDRALDWRSRHDERSKNFPVTALFEEKPMISERRMWFPPVHVVDQGAEGACVGYAWVNRLMTAPYQISFGDINNPSRLARRVYKEAQKIDEWAGEDYEGTSILAGAKVVKQQKYIDSYYWAFGIDQTIDALIKVGPVIVGIPWYDSMYETDPNGLVNVSGSVVGGHAIVLTGYTHQWFRGEVKSMLRWRNSWGDTYGQQGDGWISPEDLERLLNENGESCVPIRPHVDTPNSA